MDHITRIQILTHENYYTWRIKIRMVLDLLDAYETVDQDPPSKDDKVNNALWIEKDKKAMSIILLRISDELIHYVTSCSTSKTILATLADHFKVKDLLAICNLFRRFNTMQKDPKMPIGDHIYKMWIMAEQLKDAGLPVSDQNMALSLLSSLINDDVGILADIDLQPEPLSVDLIRRRYMRREETRMTMNNEKTRRGSCFR